MILSPSEDNMLAMAVANLFKHKIRFPARSSLVKIPIGAYTNFYIEVSTLLM